MRPIALIFALFTLKSVTVFAQGDVDQEAREAFKEGIAAFDEGQISDALVSFQRAYSLRPAFKLLYNIGQAQTELGLTRQAISTFERYLRDGGEKIEPDRRLTVEAELSRLRILAGVAKPDASGAEVGKLNLKITISPHKEENRFAAKGAPWLLGGTALTTAVLGTVFGLRAASANKSLGADCPGGNCAPGYEDDIDKMNGSAVAADVLFISTAVLSAAAIGIAAAVRHRHKKESR